MPSLGYPSAAPLTAPLSLSAAKSAAGDYGAIDPAGRYDQGSGGNRSAGRRAGHVLQDRGSEGMTKRDIAERVAGEAGMSKQAAEAAVGAVFASIADALARGEDVTVTGFGRFARNDRPAREGRNPRTGERIAIGPSAGVSFKAGKTMKDALNGG